MNRKKRTALKTAVIGFAAIATSLTIGMTAACTKTTPPDDDDDKTTTKIDNQLIKNGNFEFYSDNKGLYPISSPDSWTGGTRGNSSASMSGIIDTSKKRWDYITDKTLPKTLEDNDDLKSDDKNKKDYNGALTDDLPYKNPHTATQSNAEEKDKEYIGNPFTHSYRYNDDGKVIDGDGNEVTTYADEDGKLYLDEDFKTPLETSVLMLHNYRSSYYTGTESYYNSSTTITLEANTACEISVWVKTDELYFDGAKASRTEVEFERGAYIKVNTQVGGNSLDEFVIKNINTQKLNPAPLKETEGDSEDKTIDYENWENNGWVQYTVYVEASNFAETTVNLSLGLGEDDIYTVEGYAFFDDITFTKYLNNAEMTEKSAAFPEKIDKDNTSHPLEPNAKTEFRVDKETYQTNGDNGGYTTVTKENNFADRHFFIDFASSTDTQPLALDANNVKAGLTVDETSTGKFVSSKGNYNTNAVGSLANGASDAFLPTKLPAGGINVSNDLIGTTNVTNAEDWNLNLTSDYNALLTDALKTAAKLPGVDGSTNAMYMLSAMGAAYEAQITDASFNIGDGERLLITFWIKTADMSGSTAATIKAVDADDNSVSSSSFTVDSTTETLTNIGDNENVYNGWVKCFVRVENTSRDTTPKNFKIVVNFGNTAIKGTTSASYKAGWLTIANMSVMSLDKDVYGYSSGAAHSTTLSYTETVQTTNSNFDSEQGDKNVIKTDLATPSSYTGVNGKSINVEPTYQPATEYDKTNANKLAGLLNKENVANYDTSNSEWFSALREIERMPNKTSENVWNKVFGSYAVQPLLIVNKSRNFSDVLGSRIYNYGYVANTATSVSSSGYTALSVRVKASRGAIANVYLIDGSSKNNSVASYTLPKYNFWYDDDGNILKGKPKDKETAQDRKDNIAYSLRNDGLYNRANSDDNKLYANFYNLTRYYDMRYEHSSFYNENGELVPFEELVQGEIYYADAAKTAYAPHHLVASGNGNSKVYEYNTGIDENASYYYMEKQAANKNKIVYGISSDLAELRYDYTESEQIPYQFTIDTTKNPEYADKWITVTFYIHAGSEAKSYRLELWSGARDEQSSYAAGTNDSYVVFDHSSISLDQSTFDGMRDAYVNEILADYRERIESLEDNDGNIADLEKLAEIKSTLYNYIATYYTFSLYDSAAFIPFNGETAEKNQSGYSFSYSDSAESLAFLKIDDVLKHVNGEWQDGNLTMSAFIDYSVIDKDIDIIGVPTPPTNDDNSNTTTDNNTNVWLLAASIVLVAAILVAIAAIFIRFMIKKVGHKKTVGKNSYNFNKNKRYVKKYVKANGEAPEIAEAEVDESLLSDKPEESTENVNEEPKENSESANEEPKENSEGANEEPKESSEGANEEPKENSDEEGENKPDDGNN